MRKTVEIRGYYLAFNLLKRFTYARIQVIRIKGFYNADEPIYGKIIGDYKLAFFLHAEANLLSLRLYYGDTQKAYQTIRISKKEVVLMQRVFEMAKNES